MKKYDFFGTPTQVKFWDAVSKNYVGGIAYRDGIICGCCGAVFVIDDIYKSAPSALDNDPIIKLGVWKPIDYDICRRDH